MLHRIKIRGLIVLGVLMSLVISLSAQTLPPVNQEIVNAANNYQDGRWGGQCRHFVGNVLRDVGMDIGAGYRQAYLKYGIEVNSVNALAGDIIQISDDSNAENSPEPGYHSAVILANNGGGNYYVKHSNWRPPENSEIISRDHVNFRNWINTNYPNSGLTIHFYRFYKPGYFSDGWHSGVSAKFLACYLSHGAQPVVGKPIDRGKTPYVHYWPDNGNPNQPGDPRAFLVQDFQRSDGRYWMLAHNPYKNSVFAAHDAILNYYLTHWGWRDYGPPMSNEIITTYYCNQFGIRGDQITIQTFCKESDSDRRVIGWNARTGVIQRCRTGVFSYSDHPGAIVYEWKNWQEIKWADSPTGNWLFDADNWYHFVVRDKYGNQLQSFTLYILEGNCQFSGPTIPILSVSPTSLDFGNSETQKTFNISNIGGGTLTWNISDNRSWIDYNPTNGSGNKVVTVTVDRSRLSVGANNGIITVNSNGGTATVNIIATKEQPPTWQLVLEAENMVASPSTSGAVWGDYRIIWSNGEISKNGVNFPKTGNYDFKIRAKGDWGLKGWPLMELRIDNLAKGTRQVNSSNWVDYIILANVSAGNHKVAVAFTNDDYNPPYDCNLYVDKVVIVESDSPPPPPPTFILNEDFVIGLGVFNPEIHNADNADIYPQNGSAVIDVYQAGQHYHVQLKALIPVSSGNTYSLEFRARGENPRSIQLQLLKETDPWTHYGFWQEVNLGNSWQVYSYEFTSSYTDNQARFTFHAGGEVGKVYIDYVKIWRQSLSKEMVVSEGENNVLIQPEKFSLAQNYPNPFNPITTIPFSLPTAEYVNLKVFDILGREIITLIDASLAAGTHQIKFDAGELTDGIYFYLNNKKMPEQLLQFSFCIFPPVYSVLIFLNRILSNRLSIFSLIVLLSSFNNSISRKILTISFCLSMSGNKISRSSIIPCLICCCARP